VSPLHVTFYLNGVIVATYFDRGGCRKVPSCIIILMLELKEFLERRVAQFHVYIWYPNVTIFTIIWIKFGMKHKCLSIVLKCLIKSFTCKIHISCQINLTSQIFIKILTFFFPKYPYTHVGNMLFIDDTPCKIMFNKPYSASFLEYNLNRHDHYLLETSQIFIKILTFFFSKYPYTNVGNMLYADDMPWKIMFNGSYNAFFWSFFNGLCGHDHYLLEIVLPY
jgi:hypothetical protein